MFTSPRDDNGDLIAPENILNHVDLSCEHLATPRIFKDPVFPEQIYMVCAEQRACRCDYLCECLINAVFPNPN